MKDITEKCISDLIYAESVEKLDELKKMKQKTPARIGIGHAGARYKTEPMLRFLADQAAASDAVFSEVKKEVIEELGVFEVKTKCKDKYEMLTRPDFGRIFEEDTKEYLKEHCKLNSDVQIILATGCPHLL